MTVASTHPVGRIAAEHPMATKVFHRHHIDYCCGGGKPLDEACAESGAELDVVLREIEAELSDDTSEMRRWDEAPLDEIIDHILVQYHRPLTEELPRLRAMADKVQRAHGDKDPELFSELVSLVEGLSMELIKHMAREERILFPAIREGHGALTAGPMQVMEEEHEFAGDVLKRLRELTNDYQAPPEACNTWRALWVGLAALEEQLHQHIHLENNILFPRALES